jgi:hypothetical protein
VVCPVGDTTAFSRALADLARLDRSSMHEATKAAVADLMIDRMVDRHVDFHLEAQRRRRFVHGRRHGRKCVGRYEGDWKVSERNPWMPWR